MSKQTQVMFTARGGTDFERKQALKDGLTIGKIYNLRRERRGTFRTEYTLEGSTREYNSCLFEVVNNLEHEVVETYRLGNAASSAPEL